MIVLLLVAIPLAFWVGLNFYFQTSGVNEQVRLLLSRSFGVPVTIQGIHATPWGGLRISKLAVDTKTANLPKNTLFTAESADVYPALLGLLRGEIAIRNISISSPVIQITRSQAGTVIPDSLEIGSSNLLPVPEIKTAPAITPGALTPPQGKSSGVEKQQAASVETILRSLPSLQITDATFTLLNENDLPIATLQGINLGIKTNSKGDWKGVVKIERTTIGTSLVLHEIHSPVTVSSDTSTLSLNGLDAILGAGKLSGEFSLILPPAALRYHANLHLTGALLKQFLADASIGAAGAEGGVTGDLELSGIAGSGQTMEGKGNILCTDAVLQPADFLRQIGQILQIEELQLLRLAEAKALFSIHEGRALIEDLTLRSDNLILTARGPLLLTGDLDLQARLLFNEKLTSRIRGLLGPQLSQAPEQGYTQVSFHVAGTVNNPKTDLLERLTGIHLGGNLGGFLQGLFGHPQARPQAPPVTPSPTSPPPPPPPGGSGSPGSTPH